jgi:hypothetical protein
MDTITAYRYTADPTGKPENRWTDYSLTLPAPHYGFDAQLIHLELMTGAAAILNDGSVEVHCEHVDTRPAGLYFQEEWSGAPICSPRWNGRYVETITLQTAIAYGIARIVD